MSRNAVTSKAFALLACSVLLTASIGCNPGSVTAPSSAPQSVVDSPNFIHILSSSSKGDVELSAVAGAAKVISAEFGGTISNGRVTLEFPPHALNEDTEISIEMLGDGTLGVELGPHGIQFNTPVTMTMDLRNTTAEGMANEASTLWYNENQDRYERIKKVSSDDANSLKAMLEHFSKYSAELG